MDHKIDVEKKSPWGTILIVLLSIVMVAMIAGFFLLRLNLNNRLKSMSSLADNLAVTTTKIKQGDFSVTLDNVTGTVRSGQSVDMYWQTSGTVQDVLVKVGDRVEKDQVLAYLDETTLDQDVLNAQLDILDAQDDYETLMNNSEKIASTLSTMVTAQQTLKDAQEKLDSMDMSRVTDVDLLIARESAVVAQMNYDDALRKFDEVRGQPADDEERIRALGDVSGYRSVRDNALAEYNRYMGEIDQLELKTREAAVELAKAELEEAEYQYNKALSGPTEAEQAKALAKIESYQTKIDSSKIIAPFAGTVTQVDAKAGDVVSYDSDVAARTVFALRIDDISTFYIDMTVSELYINNIKKDLPVKISFEAIPDRVYNGIVYNVSDVGSQSGWNISFDVTIALTDADENIKSGMTADMTLEIASVSNALYVPQSAILVNDGKYAVNFKNAANEIVEVPVEVGLISGTNVQIISDELHGDDEIQLDVNEDDDEGFGMFGMPGMMGGGMPGGGGGGMPGGGGGGGRPGGGGGRP